MKKSFFTRAFALVLTVLMLTGVCPVFTSAATNAEDDHIIVNAAEIASSITTSSFSATKSTTVSGAIRFDFAAATGVSGDNAYIAIGLPGESTANAKDYPFIKVGYKAKITNNTYVDFNTTVSKYYQKGPDVSTTTVENRLWGPMPAIVQDTRSSMNVKASQYTAGEKCYDTTTNPWTNYGYSWDWVADDATYTQIRIKPFHGHKNVYAGDYMEIEYIGFFKTEAEMNAYVHPTTGVVIDTNKVIVDAAGIANDIVPSASFTSVKSIVEDDAAMKRLVRFDITSNSSVTSDHTYIAINLNGDSSVKIKDYPYVKIGYRAKLNGAGKLDFNTNIDKYYKQGSASNVVSNRFWGPTPTITQNAFSSLNIEYTKYNGCEQGGGYNWSWVADDAKYTRLLLKPFHSNGIMYAGDFFEIEYIGFFASKEGMETYEHKTSLESFSVEPTLTVEQGTFKKLPLIVKPASAYVKVKYSSNNEAVAKVSENGNVIGLKAGTAKITATTSDNAYSADCTVTVTAAAKDYSRYIFDRDDLENLKYKLNVGKELNVVYLGGSVTVGAGASNGNLTSWRGITGNWLVSMFPDAKITNINSAMGGSGSMLGAFRLQDDVIAHNPDLVFVEFAGNDGYSKHYADGTIGMYYEYIIRTLREKCPNAEIISLYIVDQGDLGSGISDTMRPEAEIHDAIAQKYGVTGLNVGRAMCNTIHETGSAWRDYVADTVHPADKGYAVYGNVVKQYLFEKLFVEGDTPTELKAHTVPSTYYDARTKMFKPNYVRITGTDIFKSITGWTWNSGKAFSNLDTAGYIYPSAKDNSFTYEFVGTAIALYYEFAGGEYNIEYSIDGGTPKTVYVDDTNHPFNKIVKGGVASEELEYGKHTLTFSYKGAGANSALKLTRILVQDITGTVVIGDVNNDFAVDALDATALTRAVAGWASYQNINFDNGDVNDDNKVDAFDVIILSRHLADWKGYDKYFAD